jgi:hypothetical protein
MTLQRAKTLLAQVLAGHQLTKLGGRAVSCRPVSTRFSLLLFQPSGFAWPEITTAQRWGGFSHIKRLVCQTVYTARGVIHAADGSIIQRFGWKE